MIPIIYVAGPFTADNLEQIHANIREASEWGDKIRALGTGVLVPHLIGAPYVGHGHSLADPYGYEWWIKETKALQRRCDASFFTPRWLESKGARGEHSHAEVLGHPRFFAVEQVQEWLRSWREAVR